MSNFSKIPISHYKVLSLPLQPEKNSVYYLLDKQNSIVQGFITDKNGTPVPLFNTNEEIGNVQSVTGTGVTGTAIFPKVDIATFVSSQLGNQIYLSAVGGKLQVNPITSPDSSIEVTSTSTELQLQLSSSIASIINSALQPGDNISELVNDVEYVTLLDLSTVAETGDYNDLVNKPSTKARFNTELTDGDFLFVGDVAQYTDEQAQDAVGNILVNTATIDFTYNDAGNTISADVKPNSITATQLADNINISEFVNDSGYELTSNKGVPNGYPSLDSGGKVPVDQLPNSVMEYKGLYDASTNTPFLVDGVGNAGDVYKTTVAGAGVNNLNFKVNDYAIYNGTTWEKSKGGADDVNSVFGRAGAVVAQNGDYNTSLVPETTNKNYQTDNQKLFNDATSSIQTQLNSKLFASSAFTSGRIPFTTGLNSLADSSRLLWNNTSSNLEINGTAPVFNIKNNLNNYGLNFSVNGGGTLFLKNHLNRNIALFTSPILSTDRPQMAIGDTASIPQESQLYVYGGVNGANIDARGDTNADEANIDLEGNDWETNPNPASLGFSYFGRLGRPGTALGYARNNLAQIRFGNTDTALITSSNSTPIKFGINNVEVVNINSSGVQINNETANTIASFDASKNIRSLSTATYPSLTELSYVKGVTSPIQTQLDSKVSSTRTININGVTQDLSANRSYRAGLSNTGALLYAGSSVASATTINIGAVTGVITDNETNPNIPSYQVVTYAGGTNLSVPTLGSGTGTYVLLNSAGALVFQNTYPTSAQRKSMIYLSKISHPNLSSISFIIDEVDFVNSPLQQFRDLFQVIQYMNQGITITGNAGLTINSTNGNVLGNGINFVSDKANPNMLTVAAGAPRNFLLLNQSGAVGSFVTTIDPANYDVGGVTTPIGGSVNSSTIQYLYYAPGVGFAILRGQTVYGTLLEAVSAVGRESFVLRPNLVNNSILIAAICLRRTTTTMNDSAYVRILPADKFGQIGGASSGISVTNLQTAYNNSLVPQISPTDSLGAFTIQNGRASNTSTIQEWKTISGVLTASVTGNGNFLATSYAISGGLPTQYLMANGTTSTLTNPVTGTGTTNFVSKWTGTTVQGNSIIYDNGSNVGVSITSPIGKLDINTGSTPLISVGSQTSGSISFGNNTGGVEAPLIIGKTSSNDNSGLQLMSATSDTNSTADMKFDIRRNDGNTFGTFSPVGFRFQRFGTPLMDILRSGNVGIGTSAPTGKLEVKDTTAGTSAVINNTNGFDSQLIINSNTTTSTQLVLSKTVTGVASPRWVIRADATGESESNIGSDLRIISRDDTGAHLADVLYLKRSTGNIGINTNLPSTKLAVDGSISVDSRMNNTSTRPAVGAGTLANGEIRGYGGGNPSIDFGFLRLSAGAGTTASQKSYIDLSGQSGVPDMDKNIVFGTSGVEKMRIDPFGRFTFITGSTDTFNVNTQTSGTILMQNAGTVNLPVISGKSSNSTGLLIIGSTADNNAVADMRFDVRKTDGLDYTTFTNSAFRFTRGGGATPLVDILRNGNVGIGVTPTTTSTDKLQVSGNITASAATATNHVVIKSQLDAISTGVLLTTTNQSFTGIKSSTNTGSTQTNGISLISNGSGAISTPLYIENTADGQGMYINNASGVSGYGLFINLTTGTGIRVTNTTGVAFSAVNTSNANGISSSSVNGFAIQALSQGIGNAIVSNVSTAGSGNAYVGQNNGVNTFTVDKTGVISGSQYRLSALNTAPASATAAGVLGEIRYDANYMYLCVATNTWKRSALVTW